MLNLGPLGAALVVQVVADFTGVEDFLVAPQITSPALPTGATSLFGLPEGVLRIEVLCLFLVTFAEVYAFVEVLVIAVAIR